MTHTTNNTAPHGEVPEFSSGPFCSLFYFITPEGLRAYTQTSSLRNAFVHTTGTRVSMYADKITATELLRGA